MSPQLTVHNAQVSTATVEIKTLTISGKQVTLAVFRQLREEPLISPDGWLNGDPWGTVNYHPDSACRERDEWTGLPVAKVHWHVVWQQGDELRRALVWDRIPVRLDAPDAERYRSCLDFIADLPQLFIAV